MNRPSALKLLITLTLAVVNLTGCAAAHRSAYDRGLDAELSRNYDLALEHYQEALAGKPGDIEYRLKVAQAQFAAAFEHYERGRRALESGEPQVARVEFIRAIQLDPTHSMAETELARAEELIRSGSVAVPAKTVFEVRKDLARTDPSLDSQLQPTVTGPISLRITQEAQSIFETIAELAGLNIIFDPDFRSTRISVELDNLSVYEALDILALQTRTFWKPINQRTLLVAPENQQKRREYEQHVLKTIYLTNSVNPTDITEAITAIRTLLNMRFIAQSTSMNAIILRDTPDKVAIAEKIIDDIDMTKPEVLIEATILEVDRNRLRELGILPPTGTVLNFDSDPSSGAGGDGPAAPGNRISLRNLDTINSGSFNLVINDTVAKFLESDSRTQLLQNPSVRATDGKLAQIRIGSRVPVASGSFQPAFVGATGTPVVQFQYIDVGVNLDITPRVLRNREVSMTVLVQVQATAGLNIISGVALPVFTNRSIQHEIRLNEGETNILGGLITESESTAFAGIPGLIKIPILRHLFGSETRQRDQTEIIILLTPHIVKMPEIGERNLRGLMVGTETDTRFRGLAGEPTIPEPEEPEPDNADDIGAEPEPAPDPEGAVPDPSAAVSVPTDAVRFDPTALTIETDNSTELEIHVNTSGMNGADLTIEFDPSSVALDNVLDGGFLSQDGALVAVMQNIDTGAGRAIISLERPELSPALSGDGLILRLSLHGLRSGQSTLRVTGFTVRTPNAEPRTGKVAEVQITVP